MLGTLTIWSGFDAARIEGVDENFVVVLVSAPPSATSPATTSGYKMLSLSHRHSFAFRLHFHLHFF